MVDAIKEAFENCNPNNCISTVTYSTFKVFDRNDDCCFICTENEPQSLQFFTVNNPTEKSISFLAIDKCTIVVDSHKKCDCAVFDDASFYFVEMKTASTGARSKRKLDAFNQLKHCIGVFMDKINFDNYDTFALISFGSRYVFPRTSSTNMARRKELLDMYKVKLIEGNLIEFD